LVVSSVRVGLLEVVDGGVVVMLLLLRLLLFICLGLC
jgi:hypothetical protein